MENIDRHIEAILFLKGEPMNARQIAKILGVKEKEARDGLDSLSEKLSGRGIQLIKKEDEAILSTSSDSSEFAKKLIDEEFNAELSKAAVEVISIVVYKGPLSRTEIDYVRGVNSSFTLRNLLVRGLVERIQNPKDSRSYLYKPSFQLLQYLGVKDLNELPEYGNFQKKMEDYIAGAEKEEKENEIKKEDNSNSDF